MSGIGLRSLRWVGIVCRDLGGRRHFYRDVLGLVEAAHGEGWVRFEMGAE